MVKQILSAAGLLLVLLLEGCGKPTFAFDPNQPYTLQLGRGSGLRGLEVVQIDEQGATKISRDERTPPYEWEQTELVLSPSARRVVAAAIVNEGLPSMATTYSNDAIEDGEQWGVLITQGPNQKVVYFNNSFPRSIKTFAANLDAILKREGLSTATWKPGGRDLDGPLWKAVEQSRSTTTQP